MAKLFISRVIPSRITPVPAALTWKAACGREIQLNIWIGSTVKGEFSHSKLTKGGVVVTGLGGRKAMKVSAPMVMIGAVSPMARDRPMIEPVRIPGRAEGST